MTKNKKNSSIKPSDAKLLEAVALRGDREAFTKLYNYHKDAAFALAMYICRDCSRAEEAVQEAMICMWRSADTFRSQDARPWIMKIVARSSIRLNQKRREHARRERPIETDSASYLESHTHSDSAERIALRDAIMHLPEKEREVVVLYYAANLSQDMIADQIEITQRGVSCRLENARKRLREYLTKAGFASSLAGAESLKACMLESFQLSQKASSQILQDTLSTCAGREKSLLQKSDGTQYKATINGLVTFCCVGALLAAAWVWSSRSVAEHQGPLKTTQTTPTPTPTMETTKRFFREWSFAQGFPDELRMLKGQWDELNTTEGFAPCLQASMDKSNPVIFSIPVTLPNKPLLVTVRTCMTRKVEFGMNKYSGGMTINYAEDNKRISSLHGWASTTRKDHFLKMLSKQSRQVRSKSWDRKVYLVRGFCISLLGDSIVNVRQFQDPNSPAELVVCTFGLSIEQINIQELTGDELPDFVQNPEQLVKNIQQDLKGEHPKWEAFPD